MDKAGLDQGAFRTASELRIQLAQMTAASQLMERCVGDEKSRKYLEIMNQSICRMLRIVGRLELAGRLGGERTPELELKYVDLALLARELGARMGRLLAYAGVELAVTAPEFLIAQADEALVRQMVMELVSNAAKAGNHVKLSLTRHGERAVFTVEDNGPGIPSERVEYLFCGAEEAVPDWRRGGVGVAIARRAATLHSGTVVADCKPGKGLRVAASIPLGTAESIDLKDPGLEWDRGGFAEELVAFSDLLPAKAFEMKGG